MSKGHFKENAKAEAAKFVADDKVMEKLSVGAVEKAEKKFKTEAKNAPLAQKIVYTMGQDKLDGNFADTGHSIIAAGTFAVVTAVGIAAGVALGGAFGA